jgi:hypothetical protein
VFVHRCARREALHRPEFSPGERRVAGWTVGSLATTGVARPKGTVVSEKRDEKGITTAEYAVGTAAGAGLAGVLYQLVTGGFGDQMLRRMFDHVMGMLGI